MQKVTDMGKIKEIVQALPEIYQPIYGHSELSTKTSRACFDRMTSINLVCDALSDSLKKPLRVLDLGCAQGFFSLSLAERGAIVHGIDYLEQNIQVCNALQSDFPHLRLSFNQARIEDEINQLKDGEYDLVLGLSVFHHLIHGSGLDEAINLIRKISERTSVGLFELALNTEPVYWGASLPSDPRQLLSGYRFVRKQGMFPTHLSDILRPLYVCSNKFWFVKNRFEEFESSQDESHPYAQGVHVNTRKYFFGNHKILKQFSKERPDGLDVNVRELCREYEFLQQNKEYPDFPKITEYENDDDEIFLVREFLDGDLLSHALECGKNLDKENITENVLHQLMWLEERGLYHADLRSWNVLLKPDGAPVIIDYGSITKQRNDCSWPNNIFLSFLILLSEVYSGVVAKPVPIRQALLNLQVLPTYYRIAFGALFALPTHQWSFSNLHQAIHDAKNACHSSGRADITFIDEILSQVEHLSIISNREINNRTAMASEHIQRLHEKIASLEAEVASLEAGLSQKCKELNAKASELDQWERAPFRSSFLHYMHNR